MVPSEGFLLKSPRYQSICRDKSTVRAFFCTHVGSDQEDVKKYSSKMRQLLDHSFHFQEFESRKKMNDISLNQ